MRVLPTVSHNCRRLVDAFFKGFSPHKDRNKRTLVRDRVSTTHAILGSHSHYIFLLSIWNDPSFYLLCVYYNIMLPPMYVFNKLYNVCSISVTSAGVYYHRNMYIITDLSRLINFDDIILHERFNVNTINIAFDCINFERKQNCLYIVLRCKNQKYRIDKKNLKIKSLLKIMTRY